MDTYPPTGAVHLPVIDGIELRSVEPDDAQPLFALIEQNREHVGRFMWWVEETRDVAHIEAFIARSQAELAQGTAVECGVVAEGELGGIIGINRISTYHRHGNLAFWITADLCGQGLATQACRVLVRHAFDVVGLHRVYLHAATKNPQSRAVAERLGFQHEGTMRHAERVSGRYLDMEVYGLLAGELT